MKLSTKITDQAQRPTPPQPHEDIEAKLLRSTALLRSLIASQCFPMRYQRDLMLIGELNSQALDIVQAERGQGNNEEHQIL